MDSGLFEMRVFNISFSLITQYGFYAAYINCITKEETASITKPTVGVT